MELAEKVFDEMCIKELVSWNPRINGYVSVGDGFSSIWPFFSVKCKFWNELP